MTATTRIQSKCKSTSIGTTSGTASSAKKDRSALETEHQMLDCPRGQEQRIKDASLRTVRQNALRAVQTTRNTLRSGSHAKGKTRRRNKADSSRKQRVTTGSDNPAALDKLLRQMQERGPAPATVEWIPRTVRPRVTTILTRLVSESAQAAELAEGSKWDAIRWRTCMILYVRPSVLLSKPEKQQQNEGDEKNEIKESDQMKMLKEIRKKTAAGRERRMELTLEQPHGGLPTQREEGEKRRRHPRGIAASTRLTERDVTSPARQHQRNMPSAGRKRALHQTARTRSNKFITW